VISTDYKFHPAAAIFPLLGEEELAEMAQSIREHGLRESIKLHDEQVLDGRNRLTACRLAGVEPRFEQAKVNGSVANYVFDMNYHRRQLTDGGRALSAARYKVELEREADERKKANLKRGDQKPEVRPQRTSGKSRDIAAKKHHVSNKTVDAGTKVLNAAPEVVRAVERGEMKVSTAARLADAPKSVQTAAVKEGRSAVREAIEKHTPSPSEEARNDPGVKWHKAMHDIRVRMIGTREAGGIRQLTARWTPDQRAQYLSDIEEFIEELEQWKKALKAK